MANVIDEVLEAVRVLCNNTSPYATLTKGPLPPENGISIAIGAGAPDSTFLTKSMAYSLSMVINGKHSVESTVSNALNVIHDALVKATSYPSSTNYQITNIITTGAPNRIEREAGGQFLYGSSITVKFYYR